MSIFYLPVAFNESTARLDENEKNNPALVVNSFFKNFDLKEIRSYLATLVEVGITKENCFFDTASDRDGLLEFYRQLECFIEGSWLMQKKAESKRAVQKKKKKKY